MLEAVILVVFPFSMAFAAVSDMLSMTIANRVSLLLVAVFAVVAPMTGMEWTQFGWHWAAFAAALASTFTLFALGAMGGGDAKLIAATALWMGFGFPLVDFLTTAAVIGGLLALAVMALRTEAAASLLGGARLPAHFSDPKKGIPYGVALGAAGLMVAPSSPLMLWALERLAH